MHVSFSCAAGGSGIWFVWAMVETAGARSHRGDPPVFCGSAPGGQALVLLEVRQPRRLHRGLALRPPGTPQLKPPPGGDVHRRDRLGGPRVRVLQSHGMSERRFDCDPSRTHRATGRSSCRPCASANSTGSARSTQLALFTRSAEDREIERPIEEAVLGIEDLDVYRVRAGAARIEVVVLEERTSVLSAGREVHAV